MRFEWDEAKRRSNIRKHGIDFPAVQVILAGRTITFEDDRFDYGEKRFLTVGLLWSRPVTIVHTETDQVMRLISIRKASKNEENLYFKKISDW